MAALAAAQAGTWAADEAGIAACFRAMDQAPELAAVNAKFARATIPTAAQLSDPTFASAALRSRTG